MIDFGSRYDNGMYFGMATFLQWSNTAAPVVAGATGGYRTLMGMGR